MSVPQVVVVNFQYEYTNRDGNQVSIKPNERYMLVAKTNDHWWHVRKDETTKPFFVPATYVTELPPENNWALPEPPEEEDRLDPPKPFCKTEPADLKQTSEVTIRDPTSIKRDSEKDGHRISTFIIPQDLYDFRLGEPGALDPKAELEPEPCDLYKDITQADITHGGTSTSLPLDEDETPYAVSPPHFSTTSSHGKEAEPGSAGSETQSPRSPLMELKEDIHMLKRAGWDLKILDNIYESIDEQKVVKETKDIEAELTPGSPVSPSTPVSTKERTPGSPTDMPDSLPEKVEDDDLSAVYVNVPRTRRSISGLPISSASALSSSWDIPDTPDSPPNLPDAIRLGSEGWEIHTDQDSGQQYYYQPSTGRSTWDYPLSPLMEPDVGTEDPLTSPSPAQSPACSPPGPSPPRWSSDWERVLDETSGRHYYFNPVSGESSWDLPDELRDSGPPPLPEEDYPAEEVAPLSPDQEDAASFPFPLMSEYSLAHVKKPAIPRACLDRSTPAGWTLNIDPDGAWVFTSEHTQEQWIKSLDDRGQTYYYLRDGSRSQWTLPELCAGLGQCRVGNGGMMNQDGVMRSWRNSTRSQDEKLPLSHRRNASDSDASSSPEMPHNVSNLEKAGILNRTKICENGKKVRKNWALSWTVLHGGILTFHKDPKSTPAGAAGKTNQFVPEFTVDLKGATINKAAKEKSSKKNVLELKSRAGAEFLLQYDTESIITDWQNVIEDTIRQLEVEQHHSEDEEEFSEKSSSTDKEDRSASSIDKRRMSNAGRQPSSSSTSEADQKKVRNKLRKFLLKRPTLQSVKEKGYIRENVFGCHLHNLCAQEKTTVPSFVEKCIRTVERRGLGIDGIYRVSGNLAVIQKLRFKADHAEDLNLEEGNWDIHVITGALKLFFRELQEPLFPYSHFNSFVQGIKIPDYHSRVSYMSDLVKSLPPPNHDTMEVLFSHLRKVIEHGEENRMTVQNVAIVFGPTLLKPEMESSNITMYMVFQNQIIEFILNEFETIFHM
ncbi:rho GTPase-activating protein 12 isoform X2 [Colossoma macropomum]|uniref:rho GTPase-activating protein 12 isoform X2 n=1 Tax=Colossoma macropomum TaxID=42526 RepID=UPI001863B9F8|nr:rho GTPase-activating protein 12 isoform X2 [Colossoma macropomum]